MASLPAPESNWPRWDMADHPHTTDRWDDATGENLIEQIAAVGDYMVALETYRAAVKRWPKDKITLRNRARVIGEELAGLICPTLTSASGELICALAAS